MAKDKITIVVVGNKGVGKTTLLIAWAAPDCTPDAGQCPRVYDNVGVGITVDNVSCELTLRDTAEGESFDRERIMVYPAAKVVVICFSTILRESFEQIKIKWLPEVQTHCAGVPIFLAGTNIDIFDVKRFPRCDSKPEVSFEEATNLAAEIGAFKYFECSAILREGTVQILEEIVRTTRLHRSSSSSKCCIS